MGTIRKRGNTWSYRIDLGTRNGRRIQREKGGFHTRKEAQAAMTSCEEELNRTGEYAEGKKINITVQEVYDELGEESQKIVKRTTLETRDIIYNTHIREPFGNMYLTEITVEMLQGFIDSKQDEESPKYPGRKLSLSYISTIKSVLNLIFDYGKRKKYVRTNPVNDVIVPTIAKTYKENYKSRNCLTNEQIAWMANRFKNTDLYTCFLLGLNLGVRAAECFALRFSDINWKEETIDIDKQLLPFNSMYGLAIPKTPKSIRTIKMPHSLTEYLSNLQAKYSSTKEEYGEDWGKNQVYDLREEYDGKKPKIIIVDDFINLKQNGRMYVRNSVRSMTEIVKAETDFSFNYHMLRHTHATKLAENKVNPTYVMQRLGHGRIEVSLKYYTHTTDEMHTQVAYLVDDMFSATLGLGTSENPSEDPSENPSHKKKQKKHKS